MTKPFPSRVATPTAFPPAGTYDVSHRVTLLCATPEAEIIYAIDGGAQTRFNPSQLIVLEAPNQGDEALTTQHTLRAHATCPGMSDSETVELCYTMARRDKRSYAAQELHPGVWMISDYERDKFYLLKGSSRALLIDAGFGGGDLRAYVSELAGNLPIDVVITHAHPDHIALIRQFQPDLNVFIHPLDLPMVRLFNHHLNFAIDLEQLQPLHDGALFDLGGMRLRALEVPGHTPGSMVLFDEDNGYLFAGDAVGSNRPTIVDTLWMQQEGMAPIDEYLSALQMFRARVRGKVKEIYTGHNDTALLGETYLDNLEKAAQMLVDQGDACLVPSLRPSGVSCAVVGDRLSDPNWAGINVTAGKCLSAPPEKIATLSELHVTPAVLDRGFKPTHLTYAASAAEGATHVQITARTTSSHASLRINGAAVTTGQPHSVELVPGHNLFEINVTAPNGVTTQTYHLVVRCI